MLFIHQLTLGVQTQMETTHALLGLLKDIYRHEPSKLGVSSADITNAKGEMDIELNDNLEVQ